MKTIQIVLTMISIVAARPNNYDFLNTQQVQNVDNQELYGILQEILNEQKQPVDLDRYEFKIEQPKNLNKHVLLNENVFEDIGYMVSEKPTILDKIFKDNDDKSLLKSLIIDANEPKQTILNVPGYTAININRQPNLVKEEEVLRVDENDKVTRPQIVRKPAKSELSVQDDSPANQKQKLALLGLYAKQGHSIPRLDNGKINWATIVKELKGNADNEEISSESEEEDIPGTSLNEKLLKVIQRVKDSILQLPEVNIGNIDLKHWINTGSSKEKYKNDVYLNSNDQLKLLKSYLRSGGSIPFVAPSKSIWDEFLDNIQKKEHTTTTENINNPTNINGVKDQIEWLKLYQKLNKPVPKLQNNNINWTTASNKLVKKEEMKTQKPVAATGDIEINYESLGLNDLLAIIKDLRQPGMTRDKIINYLLEKQKIFKTQTEKPVQMKYVTNNGQYPEWDLKEGISAKLSNGDLSVYGQNNQDKYKNPHLPTRLSNHPAQYNY